MSNYNILQSDGLEHSLKKKKHILSRNRWEFHPNDEAGAVALFRRYPGGGHDHGTAPGTLGEKVLGWVLGMAHLENPMGDSIKPP